MSIIVYLTVQVFNRLHKLHLCSSHRDTLKYLDILGSGYDAKVTQWKDELTQRIIQSESVSSTCTNKKDTNVRLHLLI